MELPSRVQFADEKVKKDFENLEFSDKNLHKHLVCAFRKIEQNAFCGIQIPKRLIPKEYLNYRIHNLWKYNLPNAWRLLYSVESNEIIVIAIVLEWFSHKEYEKRFKY